MYIQTVSYASIYIRSPRSPVLCGGRFMYVHVPARLVCLHCQYSLNPFSSQLKILQVFITHCLCQLEYIYRYLYYFVPSQTFSPHNIITILFDFFLNFFNFFTKISPSVTIGAITSHEESQFYCEPLI